MKRTQLLAKAIAVSAAVIVAGIVSANPGRADPADDPCSLAVTFLCRFVPIAPDLDGDIDLTNETTPADPAVPQRDSLPPVDICDGCSQPTPVGSTTAPPGQTVLGGAG